MKTKTIITVLWPLSVLITLWGGMVLGTKMGLKIGRAEFAATCRGKSIATLTTGSGHLFGNLSSNEMQNVVWVESRGKLVVTNQATIKDLTSVLSVIKGTPADNRQKMVAVGDLRRLTSSGTNVISFYVGGIVTVKDDSFYIDPSLMDKILSIIHQPLAGRWTLKPSSDGT